MITVNSTATPPKHQTTKGRSTKGVGPLRGEDLASLLSWDAVGKREFEVLRQELLDVWTLDVVGLLELNDLQDLFHGQSVERFRLLGGLVVDVREST